MEDLDEFLVDDGYCQACLDLQGGRVQKVYRFPNGYGASLISSPRLGKAPTWTIMALRFLDDGYEPTDVPGVVNGSTSDWTASQEKLRAIWRLPHF